MQVVLVSRTQSVDQESRPITRDYRLEINLGTLPLPALSQPHSHRDNSQVTMRNFPRPQLSCNLILLPFLPFANLSISFAVRPPNGLELPSPILRSSQTTSPSISELFHAIFDSSLIPGFPSTYKPHALTGFSAFGSGLTNEFATFTAGREHFMSSASVRRIAALLEDAVADFQRRIQLREKCEDDIRSFAERSDHTEVSRPSLHQIDKILILRFDRDS